MKKILIFLIPFLFSGCMGFKLTRIYKPDIYKNYVFDGFNIKIDSASVEHAMYQDRLRLEFVSENRESNSKLYGFAYYHPSFWHSRWLDFFQPVYEKSNIINIKAFNSKFRNCLFYADTLLLNSDIERIETFFGQTGQKFFKLSGISNDSLKIKDTSFISLFSRTIKNGSYTTTHYPTLLNPDKWEPGFGQPNVSGVPIILHLASPIGAEVIQEITNSAHLKQDRDTKHNLNYSITKANPGIDLVLLNYHKEHVLPTVSDSYQLIQEFAKNEISGYNEETKNVDNAIIEFKIIERTIKAKLFWTFSSGVLLLIPNIFGYPLGSIRTDIIMETNILDKNNNLIKSYTTSGTGNAHVGLYFGYTGQALTIKWYPSAVTRAATSKALYSSLLALKKQLLIDKDNIGRLINK